MESHVLAQLKEAKRLSDIQEYEGKNAILRRLMQEHPQDFEIDSPEGPHPGITHKPTGFKIHMQRSAIPGKPREGLTPKAASAVSVSPAPTEPRFTGPAAIKHALSKLNLDQEEQKWREALKTGRSTLRGPAVQALNAIEGLRRNNVKPHELLITKVPVIPPAFRPFTRVGDMFQPGDANELYAEIFNHRDVAEETARLFGQEGAGEEIGNLYAAVKATYGYGDPVSARGKQRQLSGFLKQVVGTSPKMCYDDETEILTIQGWVPFSELSEGVLVATINPATLGFEWQLPTAYTHERYIGEMFRWESLRYDLLVTPNHRMWSRIRKRKTMLSSEDVLRSGWDVTMAWELASCGNRRHYQTAAVDWDGAKFLPNEVAGWSGDLFAQWLGWWLAEGDTHTDGTVATVWQTKANVPYCEELDALWEELKACGIPTSKIPHRRDGEIIGWGWAIVSSRALVTWLRENCGEGAGSKRIPPEVRNWPKAWLHQLVTAYLKGDGAKRVLVEAKMEDCPTHKFRNELTDSHRSFVTVSKRLFDDLSEVFCKLGTTVVERKDYPELRDRRAAARGQVWQKTYVGAVIGRWCCTSEALARVERYDGQVHCCSVPNGLLVVRRNGKQIVSGNSWLQRKMVSKPLDQVARGAITVDPELSLDQIGVPEDMAWKMYENYVQRRLVRTGLPLAQARQHVVDRTPLARKNLDLEIQARPVLYSRSPAWHKFSNLAGHVKIVEGNQIAINPLVTTGLNADFDGDQCLNQVLACIPASAVEAWSMSYHNLASHEVRFPQGSQVPAVQDGKVYLFDLEDFPHGDLQRSKEGEKGRIDFHEVPHPIQVISYDEQSGQLVWADVAFWSKHYGREIEIIDTHNGYQLITDDDPRAVYGTAAGYLRLERFTPTAAESQGVLVPRMRRTPGMEVLVTEVAGGVTCQNWRALKMREVISLDSTVGWVLGAMTGDGWVIKAKSEIRGFALADNDGFNVKKLRDSLSSLAQGVQPSDWSVESSKETDEDRHGSTVSYRFTGANFGAWFRSLIGGERDENTSGSANKHLPPFYLSAPEEFRLGLFAGLMDTDGSISVSGGKKNPQLMASFSNTSIRLVMETKLLAASLGIFGRITPSETPKGKPFWMLTFSNGDIQRWGGQHMVHEEKLEKLRSVPQIEESPVTAKYDIVPTPAALADALAKLVGCPKIQKAERVKPTAETQKKKATQALYMPLAQTRNPKHVKYGALSRQHAQSIVEHLGRSVVEALPGGEEWLKVVDSEDVTWERVIGVQKTGIREDGYDLTVPDFETFMAADGIILSNTINLHVPATEGAVADGLNKLMPSKMLLSIRDPEKVVPALKHEQLSGLYGAQVRPAKQKHQFASKAEALQAIKTKQISLQDEIEYPGSESFT